MTTAPLTGSKKNEPHRDKTNKMACAPSEDSDQPGHPPSLISLRCPLDAQADLSLRWAYMPFCWFCHDAAQILRLMMLQHW